MTSQESVKLETLAGNWVSAISRKSKACMGKKETPYCDKTIDEELIAMIEFNKYAANFTRKNM